MFVCKCGKHVFMYSAPTDHESALDLWQCVCIIARIAGWGGKKSLDLHSDLLFFFFLVVFFPRGVLISAERAQLLFFLCPPTLQTIVATWLSPGHPGSLHLLVGWRQHLLLAIKIAEDKRQAASTSWQSLPEQAVFFFFFFIKG